MTFERPTTTTTETSSASAGSAVDIEGLRTAFANCRADISRRVQDARSTSEQEVLAIGTSINKIVERAKTYVNQVSEQLKHQVEREAETTAMIKDMSAAVHKQEDTVQRAMAQSSAILRAGRDVQAMASATRLLSLNARVEASRLGDQGSSFSVIADEMRQLSHAVQQTNSSVASMAKELERLLPQISGQARSIHQQFEQLTKHVEMQLRHDLGESGNGQNNEILERIVSAAYEALSHLAFQDPMAQSLERIHDSLDAIEAFLSDRPAAAPPRPPTAAAPGESPTGQQANAAEAGDVMLF